MKYRDCAKLQKDFIYKKYLEIIPNANVEYEKITRSKMLQEIAEYYSNPDNLLSRCTLKEIEYLHNYIHGNEQTFSLSMTDYLYDKFLLFDSIEKMNVFEDLYDSINEAYKSINDEKLKERDRKVSTILGLLRVHGIMPERNIYVYAKLLLNIEDKEIEELLCSEVGGWNLGFNEKNDKGIPELFFIGGFTNYLDTKVAINKHRVLTPKLLSIEEYQKYYYYGIDLNKDYNQKLIDGIKKDDIGMVILEYILSRGVLAEEIEDNDEITKYATLNIPKEEFLEAVYKAVNNYPSAALNGNSKNEYEKIESRHKESRTKMAQSYEPQRNACIGDNEADIFYDLFFDVLAFINDGYKIDESISDSLHAKFAVEPKKLVPILEKFYENPKKHIDELLLANGSIYNNEERKIIEDFKKGRFVRGVLVAYKKDHAELLTEDGLYAIKGIQSNLDEIIPFDHLPCFVTVGLLMYKGHIITDGIIQEMPITIGPNSLEHILSDAKKEKLLYTLKEAPKKFYDMFGEEKDISKMIIKKTKTDLLSSLKNLNKEYAKNYIEENYLDGYKDWRDEVMITFEDSFYASINHPSAMDFFSKLVFNENTDNIVFPTDDVFSNIVFLYEEDGKLKYYIPDEIKKIILKKLKISKDFS